MIARALLLALACSVSHAAPRSAQAKAEFRNLQPCPATSARRGACPGWVIDHVEPLCAGGADAAHNLQWQTVEDAKAKDRAERATCRRRPAQSHE